MNEQTVTIQKGINHATINGMMQTIMMAQTFFYKNRLTLRSILTDVKKNIYVTTLSGYYEIFRLEGEQLVKKENFECHISTVMLAVKCDKPIEELYFLAHISKHLLEKVM